MSNLAIPFNIELLTLTNGELNSLKPVRSLDIFEGSSKNFHPDGLFSQAIFGRPGEERRQAAFSYLDIKVQIFHPVIYRALTDMKRMYAEIISGKTYAVFDDEIKDFVKSDVLTGQTGFHFFLENWQKIVFETRNSDRRALYIELVRKYKMTCMTDKIVVMPAGLRDYEIDANGRESENEINNFYRKLLAVSNSIAPQVVKSNPAQINAARNTLQQTFNDLYTYLEGSVEGKHRLMMGKWATRSIRNGTRNVITTMETLSESLESVANVGYNDTVVGLYQVAKAVVPVTMYKLRNNFLPKVFPGPNSPVFLVNKKTLKKEAVTLPPSVYDHYMSDDGIETVITMYGEESLRHKELEINGYWLGLIYRDGKSYKFFQDIDELPANFDKKNVKPITYTELIYEALYKDIRNFIGYVTRYPVTGFGSIYPSYIFLKPTVKTEILQELGDDWQPTGNVAPQFPTKSSFFNAMSPHPSKLAGLTADFDGDMCSLNIVYTEEAVAEGRKLMNDRRYYVTIDGKPAHSIDTDTVRYLMAGMTGEPDMDA